VPNCEHWGPLSRGGRIAEIAELFCAIATPRLRWVSSQFSFVSELPQMTGFAVQANTQIFDVQLVGSEFFAIFR
jgi:hypothetical protein